MSQVRAGAAYVELLTRDAKLVKGLQSAQKRLESLRPIHTVARYAIDGTRRRRCRSFGRQCRDLFQLR